MRLLWSVLALAATVIADSHIHGYQDIPHEDHYIDHYVTDPDLSIGTRHPLSEDRATIHKWKHVGTPQIYSDRIVLTGWHSSGNQQVGLWTEDPNPYSVYSFSASFRASGDGGSLYFWVTAEGIKHASGIGSLRSPPWNGLLIAFTTENHKGVIRGYLNDGKIDYSKHPNPTSLAFGDWEYDYRNRPNVSKLQVTNNDKGLAVEIDGKVCFAHKKVHLPSHNYFGVTTETEPKNPDHFTLFNFFVSSPEVSKKPTVHDPKADYLHDYLDRSPERQPFDEFDNWRDEHGEEDHEAQYYKTHEEQFADVHNRLQALTHHMSTIKSDIGFVYNIVDTILQHQEAIPTEMKRISQSTDQTNAKITAIENLLHDLKASARSKDYTGHFEDLRNSISEHHTNLLYSVPAQVLAHSSKIGMMLFMVILVQIGLAVAYMLYKRRRHSSPKKYL